MQETNNPNLGPHGVPVIAGPTFLSLLDYLKVIIKHRKMIAIIVFVVTAATAGYSLTLPNIYTAKAKILPPQQQAGLLSSAMMQGALAAMGGGDILGESKTAKLYMEMFKIESLRDPIINRFKLQEVYEKKYREDVYKAMNKTVTVIAGKEGIITISVDDKDPRRAADIANAMVDELKKLTTSLSMTGAVNSKGFLEVRIAEAKADLASAETNLKAFQSKYKTLDTSQQASLSASASAQLAAQLTGQEIQLGILRRTYADSSQEVKALNRSIAVLKDKIGRIQSGAGTDALPGFEQMPERGQEYLHLMRKFKSSEAVYEMLAKQYEVAKLNAENDVSSIQVIQKALVPERKSKPSRLKLVTIALYLSLLGSCALAFLVEALGNMPVADKARWKQLFKSPSSVV